jgi:hypothetical protein
VARVVINELDAAKFDPLLIRGVAKGAATSLTGFVNRADGLVRVAAHKWAQALTSHRSRGIGPRSPWLAPLQLPIKWSMLRLLRVFIIASLDLRKFGKNTQKQPTCYLNPASEYAFFTPCVVLDSIHRMTEPTAPIQIYSGTVGYRYSP